MKNSVIFVGTNPVVFEYLCRRSDIQIQSAYCPPSHKESAAILTIGQVYGVRIVWAGCSDEISNDLSDADPVRLGICCYFNMLKPSVFEYPELGFINIHPSWLPAHKGRTPWFYMLANNEWHSGVTVHKMTCKPDGGDILARRKIPIMYNDAYSELAQKTDEAACQILNECLGRYLAGTCHIIVNKPGGAELGVKKAVTFSFADTPLKIYNIIRTQAVYVGCAVQCRGKPVFIRNALLDRQGQPQQKAGTVIRVEGGHSWIAVRDGLSLKVSSWMPDDFMPIVGDLFSDYTD